MKKLYILFLLLLFSECNFAQSVSADVDLFYLKVDPKVKMENPPLLILLHGLGSNENDLYGLAPLLPDSFMILSVRAPRTVRQGSYRWYDLQWVNGVPVGNADEQEESRKILISFIKKLPKELKFDKNQIYLCGFSQGAIMSYHLAFSEPELIKGFIALSGKLPDNPVYNKNSKAFKSVNALIIHGTEDKVLSVEGSRVAKGKCDELGIKSEYAEFKMPHTINRDVLNLINTWLLKQG